MYCQHFTRSSDVELTLRADAPEVIAESLKAKWDLQIEGGAVITNPIPEEFAMDEKVINDVIQTALKEAEENHIHGKTLLHSYLEK